MGKKGKQQGRGEREKRIADGEKKRAGERNGKVGGKDKVGRAKRKSRRKEK